MTAMVNVRTSQCSGIRKIDKVDIVAIWGTQRPRTEKTEHCRPATMLKTAEDDRDGERTYLPMLRHYGN